MSAVRREQSLQKGLTTLATTVATDFVNAAKRVVQLVRFIAPLVRNDPYDRMRPARIAVLWMIKKEALRATVEVVSYIAALTITQKAYNRFGGMAGTAFALATLALPIALIDRYLNQRVSPRHSKSLPASNPELDELAERAWYGIFMGGAITLLPRPLPLLLITVSEMNPCNKQKGEELALVGVTHFCGPGTAMGCLTLLCASNTYHSKRVDLQAIKK